MAPGVEPVADLGGAVLLGEVGGAAQRVLMVVLAVGTVV